MDKPNVTLSAEKKGSLCYPDIESFFWRNYVNNNKISNNANNNKLNDSTNSNSSSKKEINICGFNYPYGGRKGFYEKLRDNLSLSWPTTSIWSFKNRNKIYGTVQFDSVIYGNFHLNKIDDYYTYVINKLFLNKP